MGRFCTNGACSRKVPDLPQIARRPDAVSVNKPAFPTPLTCPKGQGPGQGCFQLEDDPEGLNCCSV
jgi:hypothetical protein